MAQEYIELHGARENSLKNVSLKIPKRKITAFTGVSGSGKSSIVFDTIVIEHHMGIIANADWIIDPGPEGGHRGGEVIFEGTPRDLLKAKQSSTGRYLRERRSQPEGPHGVGAARVWTYLEKSAHEADREEDSAICRTRTSSSMT
jgi:excinuclease UvrABC ATPase subunit